MKKTVFGARLASERKRLGLTVADMAERCGIKSTSQYLYEKGDRYPNAAYLEEAFSIGVKPEALFNSLADSKLPLSKHQLKVAFFEADSDCRDEKGRPLDVTHRFEHFTQALGFSEISKRSTG